MSNNAKPHWILVKDWEQAAIALKLLNQSYGTDYVVKDFEITIPLGLKCILGPKEDVQSH